MTRFRPVQSCITAISFPRSGPGLRAMIEANWHEREWSSDLDLLLRASARRASPRATPMCEMASLPHRAW